MFPISFLADDPNGIMQKIADIEDIIPTGVIYDLHPMTLLLIVALSILMISVAVVNLFEIKKKYGTINNRQKLNASAMIILMLLTSGFTVSRIVELASVNNEVKNKYEAQIVPLVKEEFKIQNYEDMAKCKLEGLSKENNFFPHNFCLEFKNVTLTDSTKKDVMQFKFNENSELILN